MARKLRITKRAVDAATPEESAFIIWDTEVPGFGLKVNPKGRKVYLYKYRVGGGRSGTMRKPTIAVHGEMTPDQAREIARDWAAAVRRGGDPSGERQAKRAAPLMVELFDRYLSDHARPNKKASSIAEDGRLLRIYLRPHFDRMKIGEVTREEVDRFHKGLSHVPYRANRCIALLSKAFNLAEVWNWRPDASNPCRHVKKFAELKRKRYLSEAETARLGKALVVAERGELTTEGGKPVPVSPYAVAAIRLLIFTGARRGEILGLKWDWVNFDAARLDLPDSKTGAKSVYLSRPAIEILRTLPRVDGNSHVIVGGKPGAPLVNLKDPWIAIRTAAGLAGVRLHDLRHSFASFAVSGGMSLPVLGALLGHRDTTTTDRYAHLADDPLRSAVGVIGQRIDNVMNGKG